MDLHQSELKPELPMCTCVLQHGAEFQLRMINFFHHSHVIHIDGCVPLATIFILATFSSQLFFYLFKNIHNTYLQF